MATYGISFYGTSLYGAPLFLAFDARPFTASPEGYGAIRLEWTTPKINWDLVASGDTLSGGDADDVLVTETVGGSSEATGTTTLSGGDASSEYFAYFAGEEESWSQLRLVRSSYGYPMFPEDGILLLEQGRDPSNVFVDRDVRGGRFYYYSIFVFADETEQWIRAGDAIGLATADHGYCDQLFESMPQFMRQADGERRANAGVEGPLYRYLCTLGAALDHIRTEYESLRWVRNPDQISGGLIWPLAAMFGVPFEPAIGMRQARVWLRDATYLYRIKGTRPGVEAAASAMTGWGARVTLGKNLFRADGVPGWYSAADLSEVSSPDDPSIPAMLVDGTGPHTIRTAPIGEPGGGGLPRWYGIPVKGQTDYAVSGFVRPTATGPAGRNLRWKIEWYTITGAAISSAVGTPTATAASTWESVTMVANSPANGAYAVVSLEDTGVGSEEYLVRRVQFEMANFPTSWEPARAIVINFDPVRWNFLPNPSFANSLYGWVVTAGTGGVDEGFVGPATGGRYAVLDGSMESIMLGLATSAVPHVFSLYAEGTGDITLGIHYYSAPGDEDPSASFEQTTSIAGSGRVLVSGPAPINALFAKLTVQTTVSMNLGSSLFEEGSVAGDYFDGGFFGADYLWAESAGISASKYYPSRAARNFRVTELLPDYLPLGQSFLINYVGGAPASGVIATGDEGTLGVGTYGIMPFGQ